MARRKKRQQGLEEDSGFGPAPIGPTQEGGRLTPLDVQQKVFRLAFRGYNEQDVDQFLDQVTEDLAALHEENKRLREELELRGSSAGFDDAKRHAEEMVRRAREEAARIMAEAERHVNLAAGMGGSPAPAPFLVRERDFLQELASLVQRHAETLKDEARRARQQQEAVEPEPQPEPEPSPPPPDPTAPTAAASGGSPEDEELLREWSSAFGEGQESEAPWSEEQAGQDWTEVAEDPLAEQQSGVPGRAGGGDEEEPSLGELFWGED